MSSFRATIVLLAFALFVGQLASAMHVAGHFPVAHDAHEHALGWLNDSPNEKGGFFSERLSHESDCFAYHLYAEQAQHNQLARQSLTARVCASQNVAKATFENRVFTQNLQPIRGPPFSPDTTV